MSSVSSIPRASKPSQSEMVRTETDRIDAGLIARFCRLHRPDPWTPPSLESRILQGLVRREHSLIEMRTEEENRRGGPMVPPTVMASIEATIAHLETEIRRVQNEIKQLFDDYPTLRRQRELLISIPGIAETTAARILGEMPNLSEFRDVKAVAAYAGLSPRHYQSGSIEHLVAWPKPATLTYATRFTSPRSLRSAIIRRSAHLLNACVVAARRE